MAKSLFPRFAVFVIIGMSLFFTAQLWLANSEPRPSSEPDANGSTPVQAVEARVTRVIENTDSVQRLELEILNDPYRGERIEVEQPIVSSARGGILLAEGDQVLLSMALRPDGSRDVGISTYLRTGAMALLALMFIALTVIVSGTKGARSLLGLGISFVVLMGFVLPAILAGRDAVLVSVVGSSILLAATLYLTLGWTLKTHAALIGVLVSLILIGGTASLAVALTRLTGFGSEDAAVLQSSSAIDLHGLLLAGMIIGTLGMLFDVVVSQTSVVMEMADIDASLGWRELYRRAMNVGSDHITATINTLMFAYIGAALPVLLLFQYYPEPWQLTLNREMIAEEVVRMIVGSMGLVATIPLTALIAACLRRWHDRHVPAVARVESPAVAEARNIPSHHH